MQRASPGQSSPWQNLRGGIRTHGQSTPCTVLLRREACTILQSEYNIVLFVLPSGVCSMPSAMCNIACKHMVARLRLRDLSTAVQETSERQRYNQMYMCSPWRICVCLHAGQVQRQQVGSQRRLTAAREAERQKKCDAYHCSLHDVTLLL